MKAGKMNNNKETTLSFPDFERDETHESDPRIATPNS